MAHTARTPSAPRGRARPELHVCPTCAGRLVHPVQWEPAGHDRARVSLRCPECDWTLTGVFGEIALRRLDAALDRGTEALVADLRKLARANMESDVERLVTAIEAGLILPEDF